MSSLGMNGPFAFNRNTIDQVVSCTRPGNYALGYVNDENTFIVQYVGRSDDDVNSRIKAHLNDSQSYSSFKFSYATSSKEAYEKECRNYHDFGGPDGVLNNKIHPDQPNLPENLEMSCLRRVLSALLWHSFVLSILKQSHPN